MKLQDLIGAGLEGGILVEYKANCGFSLEFGRATITEVALEGEIFHIRTDNEESFMKQNVAEEVRNMGYGADVEKRGAIYLISSPMGWCYVAAPKGVDVPNKPNWLEVPMEEFSNTVERHLRDI